MKYGLFLDDLRSPPKNHEGLTWILCRNKEEFMLGLRSLQTEISILSFDHDLNEGEPNGKQVANWLIEEIQNLELTLPNLELIRVHSDNGPGAENIISYFQSAQRAGIIDSSIRVERV